MVIGIKFAGQKIIHRKNKNKIKNKYYKTTISSSISSESTIRSKCTGTST